MSFRALFFYSALMTIVVFITFSSGFIIAGSAVALRAGLADGVLSAAAWGVGSLGGPLRFSNIANILAALCAALSLGLLAPAPQVCALDGGAMRVLCSFRSEAHAPALAAKP